MVDRLAGNYKRVLVPWDNAKDQMKGLAILPISRTRPDLGIVTDVLFSTLNLQRFLILCLCFSALCSAEPATAQSSSLPAVLPLEVVGKAKATDIVEIVPFVTGVILTSDVKLGQEVKAGQVLLKIDPASFQLKVDRAKAKLKNARFVFETVDKEVERILRLIDRKLSPLRGVYELRVARDLAVRDVEEAEGALKWAELDLSRTILKSPIDGFASEVDVNIGDFVSQEKGKVLTLVKYNPIRIVVGIDQSKDLRLFKRKLASEKIDFEFRLELPTGEKYPHPGKFHGFNHRVDPETGKVKHELVFPNPNFLIIPGQTVKVRVTEKGRAKSN